MGELYLARLSAVRYPGSRNALAAIRSAYAVNKHHSLADQLKLMEYKSELHRDAKNGKWTYPGWRGDVGIRLMAERWMLKDILSKDVVSFWASDKVHFQRAQALHEKMPERLPWSIWISARSCLVYGFAKGLWGFALCFPFSSRSWWQRRRRQWSWLRGRRWLWRKRWLWRRRWLCRKRWLWRQRW